MNILVQVCIFIFIATALIVDARPHNKDAAVATNVTNVNPAETAIALDELSAAELAASVAINSDSLVRDKVIAKVESIGVQEVITGSNQDTISKPASATIGTGRTNVIVHTVSEEDTLDSIAQLYNINAETIRWANNLNNNDIKEGDRLRIPPVDGVIYTVKNNDSADSIAARFATSAKRIIAYNDAEISGLKIGSEIIIPGGKAPESNSPVFSQTMTKKASGFGSLGNDCSPKTVESLGSIKAGQRVGFMGSTGNSTGKHLHLGLCDEGNYIDPVANRDDRELIAGFQWPIENRQSDVSRWFDCTRFWAAAKGNCPAGYYFHAGVDITDNSANTPVNAIGDGEVIYRGYEYGSGYTVMIKHDNGLISSYRHMRSF
ncbi:LysM peptidoglycan-binding domain-containing M23 family metallopeptidase [Candidatus Saccharibacteria bacterium]|nr:LysM peptidoglycan-binding domain-containing M23 family metallopeptidase [Candidatus Saccharibacteria bacterium]